MSITATKELQALAFELAALTLALPDEDDAMADRLLGVAAKLDNLARTQATA
jgi:hypothetical protein